MPAPTVMPVLSVAEMRGCDNEAIAGLGIPALVLMERAAWAAVTLLHTVAPAAGDGANHILILAGSGNNGGDALAMARMLAAQGKAVRVRALPPRSAETIQQTAILQGWPLSLTPLDDLAGLAADLTACDLVIDGLFGIGLDRPVEGLPADVIALLNACGLPVLALDVPSGVQADLGGVLGIAVRASWTVALGWPKPGLLSDPSLAWVGELWVADIGIPPQAGHISGRRVSWPPDAQRLLPVERAPQAHKGQFGRVLLIGGSPTMPGAIQLATAAALAGGAGYVTACVPETMIPAMASRFPAAMFRPQVPSQGTDWDDMLNRADVIAVGPGLGQSSATALLVERLLRTAKQPVILDADALNVACAHPEWVWHRSAPTVLTPHAGEAGRWLGIGSEELQADRWGALERLVDRTAAVVVLKGARTLIGSPNGPQWVNVSGSPALARGGSGDLLTGLIAALLAQGLGATDAARTAVWWHGAAGAVAAETHGMLSATWETVLAALPVAAQRTPPPVAPIGLTKLG
ncbi:MAG: NAD(P)H-hydrate dehydratase [Candidatus Sericytochromatia bacterium]|nr:NAD(P)H-hydrate dehydratase [Candidatus Sericytochromatia bacterium]